MPISQESQTTIDERIIDHAELEEALEDREKRKASAGAVRKAYTEADEKVKGMLAEFVLEDGEVARCGRFRIAKTSVPARSVSFDTDPSSRLTINAVDDD